MRNNNSDSLNNAFNGSGNGKDKKNTAQMKTVFKAFGAFPKTMKMVSVETGIDRANICRYVGKWKKNDRIQIINFGICPITKTGGVQFLTTDPKLFNHIQNIM